MKCLRVRMRAVTWVILVTLVSYVYSDCSDTEDDGTKSSKGTADLGEDIQKNAPVGEDVPVPQSPTCGGKTFDQSQGTCCNGKVTGGMSINSNPHVKCCGQTAYDSSRKTCCLANRPVGTLMGPNRACCGIHVIDTRRHICCQGKRFFANRENRCCGNDAYNSAKEVCCRKPDGKLTSRRGNACCNGQPFYNTDPRKFCCGDSSLKTQSVRGTRLCCGSALYNPEQESCFGGVRGKKTANPQTSSPFREICCGDRKIPVSQFVECCDGKLYNTVTSQCLDGQIIRKTRPRRS